MTSHFPLGKASTAQLQELGKVLWSWSICDDCSTWKDCKTIDCPWSRSTVLSRYFEYFKVLTSSYECHLSPGHTPGLATYEDLFRIIRELKRNPELSKANLLERLFTNSPPRADQERALNLAVRVVMMINCSASRQSSILLEYGNQQIRWHTDVTFSQFFRDVFPRNSHPIIEDIKDNIRGPKLKKRARLNFKPTDDLRNHLRLDRKARMVEIFHHTAFLKEQLRLTKDEPRNVSMPDLIRLGALPRELALETLDSIQKVLFPLTDPKSKELLLSLTSSSTCNFDTDILRYDSISIRGPDEHTTQYHYFGTRLADLHHELTNPTPRGFEKWFERNSGARSVMMATLAGVIFAIFLGVLSLAVSGIQAYVGYMAWKHPVENSAGRR